ncbi:MAG: hypothetical protein AB1416_06840 [Actinomycetota bacterium]
MKKAVMTVTAAAAVGVAGLLVGLSTGDSDDGAKDQVAALRTELAAKERDARYWGQLTSLMAPVELNSMTDHRAFALRDGTLIALHFDNMDLDKAENLNWVALGVPGEFCEKDQDRVIARFGKGATHFHDLENDVHGGTPGAKGVWFVHTGVRDFDAPWGKVTAGQVDANFMPTKAPACV